MDATERHPGDAEAAAAASAMRDLYGQQLVIGEEVTWRWYEWAAGVLATGSLCGFRRGRLIVEHNGELVEIEIDELLP